MQTRYEAVINGVLLSSLDDRIIVTDIREHKPEARVLTAERPVNAGSFLVRNKRESLSVTVAFVLWERDPAQRRKLLDRVTGWAAGDLLWLGVNQRPEQYLIVRLDDPPVVPSAMRWMDEITMTFTAREFPFWREIEFSHVTTVYGETGSLYVPGTAKAPVSVEITNTDAATLTTVYLYVRDKQMSFSGLTLLPGETLVIGYTERNLLYARIGETSVLNKRTAESDDDLLLTCGQYTGVMAVADVASISVLFKAQGVYA